MGSPLEAPHGASTLWRSLSAAEAGGREGLEAEAATASRFRVFFTGISTRTTTSKSLSPPIFSKSRHLSPHRSLSGQRSRADNPCAVCFAPFFFVGSRE